MKIGEQPYVWRLPTKLPPCWWVAVRYKGDRLSLNWPSDDQEEAEENCRLERKQAKEWLERPLRIEVMRENPGLRCERRYCSSINSPSIIAARWNWLRRNRDRLQGLGPARKCQVMTWKEAKEETRSSDLLVHRVGGRAVLPKGMPWPTFSYTQEMIVSEKILRGRKLKRGHQNWCTYLATFDLRQLFSIPGFPAAISIFVCCPYDESKDFIVTMPDPYVAVGVVVPLFSKTDLALVECPFKLLQQRASKVGLWEMPDFSPYSASNEEVFGCTNQSKENKEHIIQVYNTMEEMEPGTSSWINVKGTKFGGYDHYIQNDLAYWLSKKEPSYHWRLIATYGGPVASPLYILAGYNRKSRKWRWHCEWQYD
jgi:hypothetical protein